MAPHEAAGSLDLPRFRMRKFILSDCKAGEGRAMTGGAALTQSALLVGFLQSVVPAQAGSRPLLIHRSHNFC